MDWHSGVNYSYITGNTEKIFVLEPRSLYLTENIRYARDSIVANGSGTIWFLPGEYRLKEPISFSYGTNVSIMGLSRQAVRLIADFSENPALADDATNGLIRFYSSYDGLVDTTVGATIRRGNRSFTITSATNVTSGQYLEIRGVVVGSAGDSDGANNISTEIVRVFSVVGNTVTIYGQFRKNHSTAHTVKSFTASKNLTFRGFTLDASGGTIANGLSIFRSLNVNIDDVGLRGFSRTGIELTRGTQNGILTNCHREGETNGLIFFDSVDSCQASKFSCDPQGTREHALGVTRALLMAVNDCDSPKFFDGDLQAAGLALWDRKTYGAQYSNIAIRDMVPDVAITRLIAAGEHDNTSARFGIVQSSNSILAWSANSWDTVLENITVAECKYSGIANTCSTFYLHDFRAARAAKLRGMNYGANIADANTANVIGLHIRDSSGTLDNSFFRGYKRGVMLSGTSVIALSRISIEGSTGITGDPANVEYGVYFDMTGLYPGDIDGLTISNYILGFGFVPGVVGVSNPGVLAGQSIKKFTFADYTYDDVIVAINTTGTNPNAGVNSGEIISIVPKSPEIYVGYHHFEEATGAVGEILGVMVDGQHDIPLIFQQNVPFLVAPLYRQRNIKVFVRAADLVNIHDKLVLDTTVVAGTKGKYFKVDNTATSNFWYAHGKKTQTLTPERIEVTYYNAAKH